MLFSTSTQTEKQRGVLVTYLRSCKRPEPRRGDNQKVRQSRTGGKPIHRRSFKRRAAEDVFARALAAQPWARIVPTYLYRVHSGEEDTLALVLRSYPALSRVSGSFHRSFLSIITTPNVIYHSNPWLLGSRTIWRPCLNTRNLSEGLSDLAQFPYDALVWLGLHGITRALFCR